MLLDEQGKSSSVAGDARALTRLDSQQIILYDITMTARHRRISVTEAARNFADIVNRAFYRHETTVLVRNGIAVAHIAPAAPTGVSAREALARWKLIPHLGAAEATAMKRDIAAGRRKLRPLRSPWE